MQIYGLDITPTTITVIFMAVVALAGLVIGAINQPGLLPRLVGDVFEAIGILLIAPRRIYKILRHEWSTKEIGKKYRDYRPLISGRSRERAPVAKAHQKATGIPSPWAMIRRLQKKVTQVGNAGDHSQEADELDRQAYSSLDLLQNLAEESEAQALLENSDVQACTEEQKKPAS